MTFVDDDETPTVDAERVAAARQILISSEEAASIAEVFKLLGDPGRARLLYALLEAGELCVSDLAATVDNPQPTVSQGLRLLRAAGIVKVRRAGRMSYYSLADSHVRMLLDLSREHLRHEPGQSDE
jgi:DNA-binding transcriptional ArsR family regulator